MNNNSYLIKQHQLKTTINQLTLLEQYQTLSQPIPKIQILSRIKQILLKIPSQIQADPLYKKQCNDKYFFFIINQINQNMGKVKPESMRFLFHVVSLRIKLWFDKKQFDDIFNSFMLSIEHNRKMIPYFIEFLLELVEAFEMQTLATNQSVQQKYALNQQRQSLTRKTNSKFFGNDIPNRKTWRATQQLKESLDTKKSFTKQNRFQRQFSDYQLNKILIFANQVFNRSIVQNQNYNFEEDYQDAQQEQQIFFIKMPLTHVIKNLQLIHKVITFNFLGESKVDDQDDYFNQRFPLIIPTKYSKLCQYHEFQNWIKNKNDFYKYQFLYFTTNIVQLKIIIVRIFGDQLRVHQKYFKKEQFFKTHIETIITPMKSMLQNLQIKDDQEYELALVFGQNINKLLRNATFPTYLNLIKNQFKAQFSDSINQFIHKQILDKNLFDVTLIKFYFGFYVDLLTKLQINTSGNIRIKDFKEQTQSEVKAIGEYYEDSLYQYHLTGMVWSQQKISNLYCFYHSIKDLNFTYFQVFLSIFKFFTPKKSWLSNASIQRKLMFLCSKLQNSLYKYQIQTRNNFSNHSNEQTDIQINKRYCQQSLSRLGEIIKRTNQIDYKNTSQMLFNYQYLLMSTYFFLDRMLSCKTDVLLIFDDQNYIFKFTSEVLQMVLHLRVIESSRYWDQLQLAQINNVIIFSQQILNMITKLNQQIINSRQKNKLLIQQMEKNINQKLVSSRQFKRNSRQNKGNNSFLDLQNSSSVRKNKKKRDLQQQCKSVFKQLQYYQKLIKIIHQQYKHIQSNKTLKNIDLIKPIINPYFNLTQQQAIYHSIKNLQFQQIFQPIYSLYFLALKKCQNHRKQHLSYLMDIANEGKVESNSKIKGSSLIKNTSSIKNNLLLDDSQDMILNDNDDQCTVIQDEDLINIKTCYQTAQCMVNIAEHDLNQFMTPIAFYLLLNNLGTNFQLREKVNQNFSLWYKKILNQQTGSQYDKQIDRPSSSAKPQQQLELISFYQLYQIQTIIQKLVNEYYLSYLDINYQHNIFNSTYVLKCSSILLKTFRSPKYQISIKRQVIKSCYNYILQSFKNGSRNDYWKLQNQQYLIFLIDAMQNLLQTMVNVHYHEERVNFFNKEFGLIFQGKDKVLDKINDKRKQESVSENPSLEDQICQKHYHQQQNHPQQQPTNSINKTQQIYQIFKKKVDISMLFDCILTFILNFPTQQISVGYFSQIQTSLIGLFKQIYFEFSQFLNIYMLQCPRFGQACLDVYQNLKEEGKTGQNKYIIKVNNQNVNLVCKGYVKLIYFVQKSMKISFQFKSHQWLLLRNKFLLPFMNQIIHFLQNFIQNQSLFIKSVQKNHQQNQQLQSTQNQLQTSIKLMFNGYFQFLKYFLTNFQENQISFLTKNLSLIQSIYKAVTILRQSEIERIKWFLENKITQLNHIIIFKSVPQQKSSQINKKLNHQNIQNSTPKILKYKGWQYIKRLYEADQQNILQQLLIYEKRFKYYIQFYQQVEQSSIKQASFQGSSSLNQHNIGNRQLIHSKSSQDMIEPSNKKSKQYRESQNLQPKILKSIYESKRKSRKSSQIQFQQNEQFNNKTAQQQFNIKTEVFQVQRDLYQKNLYRHNNNHDTNHQLNFDQLEDNKKNCQSNQGTFLQMQISNSPITSQDGVFKDQTNKQLLSQQNGYNKQNIEYSLPAYETDNANSHIYAVEDKIQKLNQRINKQQSIDIDSFKFNNSNKKTNNNSQNDQAQKISRSSHSERRLTNSQGQRTNNSNSKDCLSHQQQNVQQNGITCGDHEQQTSLKQTSNNREFDQITIYDYPQKNSLSYPDSSLQSGFEKFSSGDKMLNIQLNNSNRKTVYNPTQDEDQNNEKFTNQNSSSFLSQHFKSEQQDNEHLLKYNLKSPASSAKNNAYLSSIQQQSHSQAISYSQEVSYSQQYTYMNSQQQTNIQKNQESLEKLHKQE